MYDIDIVVVNYRTNDDLATFIHSLEAHAGDVNYRTYVMDVHPEANHLVVGNVYKAFPLNVGYGIAVNAGASFGVAPLIGIFNADVAFPEGQLENIVRTMQEHPEWSIVGPRQVDSFGRITHAGFTGINEPRAWRTIAGDWEWNDTIEVAYVMGSAVFVRREAWDELTDCRHNPSNVGAFLQTPLYFEETWACYHARAHGLKVVYYGGATLIHEWHGAIRNIAKNEELHKLEHGRSMFAAACAAHGIEH